MVKTRLRNHSSPSSSSSFYSSLLLHTLILRLTLCLFQCQQSTSFTIPTTTIQSSIRTSRTTLFSSENSSQEQNSNPKFRFLGKGKNAIVRPGVVLVAPIDEYQHYLMKSAIFIYAVGMNEFDEMVTRGVIIDHPTAFTMGEMSSGSIVGTLAHNLLFRGGESGNDSAMLLHSRGDIFPSPSAMIGTSGIYEGGVSYAMDAADDGLVDSTEFKFFFNYMEFAQDELEHMLNSYGEEGDVWCSVEVAPEVVLNSDLDRGEVWAYLRNQIQQHCK